MKKPPIGILPEKIWEEERICSLSKTIHEHTMDGFIFDTHFDAIKMWCDEMIRRIEVLDSRRVLTDTDRKIIGMAIAGFGKIECIKTYRKLYPFVGLKEAKDKIEKLCDGYFTTSRRYKARH